MATRDTLPRVAVITTSRGDYDTQWAIMDALVVAGQIDPVFVWGGAENNTPTMFRKSTERTRNDLPNLAWKTSCVTYPEAQEAGDSAIELGRDLGALTVAFAEFFGRERWSAVILTGDRLEIMAPTLAATALGIPLVHVSGGDLTEGAIDNQIRFAVSKLSHLHFVAIEEHRERLIRCGEEPSFVHVVGEPALDLIERGVALSEEELAVELGIKIARPLALVTYHPSLAANEDPTETLEMIFRVLDREGGSVVVTAPGREHGSSGLLPLIEDFVRRRPNRVFSPWLGRDVYRGLMRCVDFMIGNSSSGIWEAPSHRCAVVNVGDRQKGRLQAGNVINAGVTEEELSRAVRQVIQPEFRGRISGVENPYGDGRACRRLAGILSEWLQSGPGIAKPFYEAPQL